MDTRGKFYERMTNEMRMVAVHPTEYKTGRQKRNERRKKQRRHK